MSQEVLNDEFLINYKRCKKIDFSDIKFDVDNTKPILLIYKSHRINVKFWNQLLYTIYSLFNDENNKTFNDLIYYKKPYENNFIFSKRKRSQDMTLNNGYFAKFLVSGNKALKVIKQLCQIYDKSFDELTIYLCKKIKHEKSALKKEIFNKTINKFYLYLINVYRFSDKEAMNVINRILKFDRYYKNISKTYDSSYLFNKHKRFYDYRTKIILYVLKNNLKSIKEINTFKIDALYLYRFYKALKIREDKEYLYEI